MEVVLHSERSPRSVQRVTPSALSTISTHASPQSLGREMGSTGGSIIRRGGARVRTTAGLELGCASNDVAGALVRQVKLGSLLREAPPKAQQRTVPQRDCAWWVAAWRGAVGGGEPPVEVLANVGHLDDDGPAPPLHGEGVGGGGGGGGGGCSGGCLCSGAGYWSRTRGGALPRRGPVPRHHPRRQLANGTGPA
jgi:hypothetical protein